MKAQKSKLAERVLADPAARQQLRSFISGHKVVTSKKGTDGASQKVVFRTADGRLVAPRLVTPKLAG